MNTDPNIRQAVFLSLIMVAIASTGAVASKIASAGAATQAIVTIQFGVCLILGLPRIVRAGGLREIRSSHLGLHFIRGVTGVLGFYLFYAALNNIPMVDAMLLRQSAPLTVPLVMWAWSDERASASAWPALIIGFVGIAVILRPSPEGLSWWHAAGFCSALTLSISMVATRKLAATEPASRILLYYFVISLVCLLPFSIDELSGLGTQEWLASLYVGVAMYVALVLYTKAYSIAPASAIAPINYFAVILTGLWGWLIWDQVPDGWTLVGSLLVICGGLLTVYTADTGRASAPPQQP